tara:strand:- start:26 stop:304 length:279 start_codon:yes stop_codon:yes gene_type:complete
MQFCLKKEVNLTWYRFFSVKGKCKHQEKCPFFALCQMELDFATGKLTHKVEFAWQLFVRLILTLGLKRQIMAYFKGFILVNIRYVIRPTPKH